MADRFPAYNVLAKRHSPSWNEVTRRVIDERLAMARDPRFFAADEWLALTAACDRIVPQPKGRAPIPVAAMVDDKVASDRTDGYRNSRLPNMQTAWRCGLKALDEEAQARHGGRFHKLSAAEQDELLTRMQRGELSDPAWGDMPPALFFSDRLVYDIVGSYYAHPQSWNDIGFGGPASPRGYVRLGADKRDPWEAAEAKFEGDEKARRKNHHVG